MGGSDGSSNFNDVWSSSDGATWDLVTGTAGWSARTGHTSVVYNNQIFVMGGYGSADNEAWSMEVLPDTAVVTSESSQEEKGLGAVWVVGHFALVGYAAIKYLNY